jgi:hypothetical protein
MEYRVREFRANLKKAFEDAKAGHAVGIDRDGDIFQLIYRPEVTRSIIEPQEQGSPTSTDALISGFGAKAPCQGHDMRIDCGRPGCKYGAGK